MSLILKVRKTRLTGCQCDKRSFVFLYILSVFMNDVFEFRSTTFPNYFSVTDALATQQQPNCNIPIFRKLFKGNVCVLAMPKQWIQFDVVTCTACFDTVFTTYANVYLRINFLKCPYEYLHILLLHPLYLYSKTANYEFMCSNICGHLYF